MEGNNRILLRGTMKELPVFSHENHGRKFYRFYLEVERLSGAVDTLPVIAELKILECIDLSSGSKLRIEGQIRSHNVTDALGRHLLIFVYAMQMCAEDGPDLNQVELEGNICKLPSHRRTPLGREICDIMLAVPRAFRRADYMPCILWGRTANELSQCQVRDRLRIYGRLQSRIYTKNTDEGVREKTAYEISALTAEQLFDEDPNPEIPHN